MSLPPSSEPHPFWPQGVPTTLSVPQTGLAYNLAVAARRYPDKPAYWFYGSALTFGGLHAQAARLAGFLRHRLGVQPGDRVMVMGQSSPQFATAVQAILRADAVVVPVNPMNLTDELTHCARDAGARVAVVAQDTLPRIRPLLGTDLDHAVVFTYADALDRLGHDAPDWATAPRAELSDSRLTHWQAALDADLEPGPSTATPTSPALIAYTSGTTGKPKGCLHDHGSLMTAGVTASTWRGDRADTVILGGAPMFHMLGLQSLVLGASFLANTVVLLPRWDARLAARLIRDYRVTHWGAVPAMLIDLLSLPGLDPGDLRSLRTIGGGGAGLPASVNERLTRELRVQYIEGWGMTETASMALCNPPERTRRQCLGIPTFGVSAYVLDPATDAVLPDGEVGELVVHGRQVMREYWNHPDANAHAFVMVNGRRCLRSGDLVYRDEEGYYFMVDRLKRMINAGGYKVWPAEVEALLHEHPDVQEACVIAGSDARSGETVKAVVVLREDAAQPTSAEFIEWTRARMAAYKCPREVSFVQALPRGATGKVDWRRLQEAVRSGECV